MKLHALAVWTVASAAALLACRSAPERSTSVPAATATATRAAASPPLAEVASKEPLQGIQARADGHLFGWSAQRLYDWDLESGALRSLALGERSEHSPYVSEHAPVFVVARVGDGANASAIEVWDARTLTLRSRRSVLGNVDSVAFTEDGARMGSVVCVHTEDGSAIADCEVDVHSTRDGTRIGHNVFAGLYRSFTPFTLGFAPSGRFFGLSHEVSGARIHASDSGRPIVRLDEPDMRFDGTDDHFVFLPDESVLTAARGVALRISNTKGVVRTYTIPLGAYDHAYGHYLSPDAKRLAVLLARGQRRRVVVWSLVDGSVKSFLLPNQKTPSWKVVRRSSDGDTVVEHPAEGALFGEHTWIRWDDATHLVARSGTTPQDQSRLDAVTGTREPEPFRETPAFDRDGYRVFGDLQMHGSQVWSQRSDAPPTRTRVVLPQGHEVDLPEVIPNRSALTTAAGKLIVSLDGGLIIVDAAGTRTRLAPARQ